MVVNGNDMTQYIKHPRVLEIRFIILFSIFEREYGLTKAFSIFESIANSMDCNMVLLKELINKRFEIRRNAKSKKIKWRQEVIFVCKLYGKNDYSIAKNYLMVTPSTLYNQKQVYDPSNFINDKWLRELDESVVLAGMKQYRIEIARFVEAMESLKAVFDIWEGD